jgi:hypothetical protein
VAIVSASTLSFLAFPPWMAFMDRAWPRTNSMPSRRQRSASQYQVHALQGDHEVITKGLDGPEKVVRAAAAVLVERGRSLSIEDAEVHGPGVQVDPAAGGVRLRV